MLNYNSLTDLAYENLKKKVIAKEFTQGERIVEEKIAEDLGISRTTARRAINLLVFDGLFIEKHRQGIFVNEFTFEKMVEIYEIRARLEGLATSKAALVLTSNKVEELRGLFDQVQINDDLENFEYMNADMAFHTKIVQYSGYELIASILTNFHLTISCFAQQIIRAPSQTYPEHIEILDAIAKKDSENSGKLMEQHILASRKELLRRGEESMLAVSG